MLDRLRTHVKGWLGMVIIAAISLSFVLLGLQSYATSNSETPLVEVGDQEIYQADLNEAYLKQVNQLKDQYGEQYSPELFNEDVLRQNALNRLVQEKLILQEVNDEGFVISDKTVLSIIAELEVFQTDGVFDKTRYLELIQSKGLTTSQFLQQLKVGLKRDQFVSGIVNTSLVDNSEVDNFYRLIEQTRDLHYLLLPLASELNSATVKEEDVKDFYLANKHAYQTAATASIDYVSLDLSELMSNIKVTGEELIAFYDTEKASFTSPARRRVSHIEIELEEADGVDSLTRSKALADNVLKRLKAGEDFAVLAKEFSTDLGSAKAGGDLGIIAPSMMGADFEQALVGLKQGEVSELIKTEAGYQIVKLTDLQAASIEPFEAVKAQVESLYKQTIANEQFYQLSERLAELSFENPDTLAPLVDELGLTVVSLDPMTEQQGTGIASSADIRRAVFNSDVIAGNNSDVIELSPEHLIVLRMVNYTPEQLSPLETVFDEIEQSLKVDQTKALLNVKAKELVASLGKGSPMKSLVDGEKVRLVDVGPVTRNDANTAPEILKAGFTMERPLETGSTFKQSAMSNGDVVIIELINVVDADPVDLSSEDRQRFSDFLKRLNSEASISNTLANLRDRISTRFNNRAE